MAVYLVTGGAGFIGSNIVGELLRRGEEARVFDNFSTGRRENIAPFLDHPSFTLIEGDLRDLDAVRQATQGVQYVLHQGALPSVPRSMKDPVTSNDVNVNGTLHVLEAAREYGVRRVVYASSSSVYGNNPDLPKHEGMPVQPVSPYALTKYAGERYCRLYFETYGLETVCLRYFNVFGPNQDPGSTYSAVIPRFADLIRKGQSPVIYGDGEQSRDFTYVSNNVEANFLACFRTGVAGQVFNIACGERYTLLDLVNRITSILDMPADPLFSEIRPGDVKHSQASIDKAREMLGFNPSISFADGLELFIRSLNTTGDNRKRQ